MPSRKIVIGLAAIAAIITAASATEPARTSGAYTSLTSADAAACARACADDGICMAWSYHRDNQCQLSAIVNAPDAQALATGFASRAPAFLQPRTPVVQPDRVEADELAQHARAAEPTTEDGPDPTTAEVDDSMLLGGPSEGDLRLGLR